MRRPVTTALAARAANPPAASPADAPTQLVCLALTLAVLVLTIRIASIW